jgi:hypothetical protein
MQSPDSEPSSPAPGRPRGPDRRKSSTPRFSVYSLGRGRRQTIRRDEEANGAFVDRYGTRLFAIAMWIALMNVADSFFTLVHLQSGGSEINPVADLLLLAGRSEFVLLKSSLIGIALLVLCIHKNFPLAKFGLWIAAGAYTVLCGYHLLLFRV